MMCLLSVALSCFNKEPWCHLHSFLFASPAVQAGACGWHVKLWVELALRHALPLHSTTLLWAYGCGAGFLVTLVVVAYDYHD